MITKMTKYNWVLLSSQADRFLNELQELGVVDITRSTKPVDNESESILDKAEELRSEIKDIKKGSDAHLVALNNEYEELTKLLAELEPWGEYDADKLAVFNPHFYVCQTKSFSPEWESLCPLQKVFEFKDKTWFVTLGESVLPIKEVAAPTATAIEIRTQAEAKRKEILDYSAKLEERKKELPELEARLSEILCEFNLYLAKNGATGAAEEHVTIFEGFAPTENDAELKQAFDNMDVYWYSEAASVDDNPPIKLKNNKFVSMFEVLTDMYGRPAYNGFDPTPYLSVFFMLFFAFCIGDLGYGLVFIIAGILLKKVDSFKSLAPLVCTLGVASVVVGFFFHGFFAIDIKEWGWIPDGVKAIMLPDKIDKYDGAMVLALIVGIIHLLLAMIVKTVCATKNKGFLNSLGVWGWTTFWLSLTIIGMISLIGVIDAEATKWALIIVGGICAIGIFILNDIHRNPLKNIGAGLWDTYGMATGILGDILSYLRLYALGLAGAKLGFAFNQLAEMVLGDGGINWVWFILIAVIGHALNIAMAALGAFVHPLRLNFLEFFKNSDYQAVGRNYKPLTKNN